MRKVAVVVAATAAAALSLLAAAGCSKTRCEKYGDMEVKCGGYPKSEEEITRAMAKGMCEGAEKGMAELGELAAKFKAESACAEKHDGNCDAYKKCVETSEKSSGATDTAK